LLCDFKKQVFNAIEQKISLNPVLHSFQLVVNQYQISNDLIEAFLGSMAIDLEKKSFSQEEYEDYIHGSAEVIGLMCLKIFCENNTDQYNKLVSSAKSLGSALQKINFLRDIKADHLERGRVYFPGVDFNSFTKEQKRDIEDNVSIDMARGYAGISQLPEGARLGVYIAYSYYNQLFNKIRKASVNDLRGKRIRVPNARKTLLYLQSRLKFSFGVL
jgi:phytoene/squalene synthetase